MPLIIASKHEIHRDKYLYTENYKTLLREIKENQNNRRNVLFYGNKRLNIVKIWSTPKRIGASLVAQSVKNLPAVQETRVQSLGWEDPLEKEMAPHSSTFAWKIPWTEEPGRLQSMGSWRVGHEWATSLSLFTFMHWRRKWQPTPVFLPGESQGRGSLVGCPLWGRTESDTTEAT